MIPQVVIVSHKKNSNSPLSRTFREFTQTQVESGEMQTHIDLKAKAGFICYKFDYNATYKNESILVERV